MNKFLIFGEARSGTTSLFRILESLYSGQKNGSHPLTISEPFHSAGLKTHYPKLCKKLKPYLKTIENGEGCKVKASDINAILDTCYEFSFGVKHLWDHFSDVKNWPFHGRKQNEFILEYARKNNIKIISLTRNNYILRSLSHFIADQSEMWNLEGGKEDRARFKKFKFKPINLFDFHHWIMIHGGRANLYRKILEPIEHYPITYEKLFKTYFSEKPHSEEDLREMRKEEIYKICNFLNIKKSHLNQEILELYTSPEKRQTIKIYKKVPNIQEIIEYSKNQWGQDMSWVMDQ